MDYFDILLAKKLEDDRDPQVEGLSVSANGRYHEDGVVYDPVIVNVPETPLSKLTVTENGTYTAPSGTAYNEVEVDVPLPENAYLLKDIPNTPTAIATFSDGSNLPMPKLEVSIEAVQEGSGDPSPTNVRPISGWDEVNVGVVGKNWCPTAIADNVVYKNGEYAINLSFNDGTITFETTANISTYFLLKAFTITKQHIGKTFTMSYSATPSLDDAQCILVLNDNGTRTNLDKSATITADMVGKELTMRFYKYGIGTYTISNVQLELGATATAYEPYNGATYTIDLDGTRYGGYLDVVSGELVVDRVEVDMGTLTWEYESSGVKFFTPDLSAVIFKPGDFNLAKVMCSIYRYVTYMDFVYSTDDAICCVGSPSGRLYIKDSRFIDATAFKTAMNGVQLVYELATPITYQLTPTQVKSLLGSNNVWADTGDILDLSYLAKEE
jgi:hypothetical protein